MTQTKPNGVNGHAAIQNYQPPKPIRRRSPRQELADRKRRAEAVRELIAEKKWSVKIRGNEHIRVEGWTALGEAFGIYAKQGDLKEEGELGVRSYRAYASLIEIINSQPVEVGGAYGRCGIDEPEWVKKPRYKWVNNERVFDGYDQVTDQQRESMAQTRAVSKAYSQRLRATAELIGFSGTPAEEMQGTDREPPQGGSIARAPAPTKPKTHKGPSQQKIKNLCQKMIQAGITHQQICEVLECDRSVMRVRLAQMTFTQFDALQKLLQ